MQEVEIFSHIKMWPKGLSGNNGYVDSSDLRRICALFWLFFESCGLPADCRIEPAVWHADGLFSHSCIKYPVFLFQPVLMNEGKSNAKILPALEC